MSPPPRRGNAAVATPSNPALALAVQLLALLRAVIGMIVHAAEQASLTLTPPELLNPPAEFTREDGSSMFRPKHHTIYSSTRILDAEDTLLELSRTTTAPTVPLRTVGGVVARALQQPLLPRVLDRRQEARREAVCAARR